PHRRNRRHLPPHQHRCLPSCTATILLPPSHPPCPRSCTATILLPPRSRLHHNPVNRLRQHSSKVLCWNGTESCSKYNKYLWNDKNNKTPTSPPLPPKRAGPYRCSRPAPPTTRSQHPPLPPTPHLWVFGRQFARRIPLPRYRST